MKAQSYRKHLGPAALAAVGILTAFSIAGIASATPIVDGWLDPGEGYLQGWFVEFAVERTVGTVTGGQLWVYEDAGTGDVTALFSQPLTLVDNTYGENSIGWGKGVAPSGKNHNFKDLLGSDKAQSVFTDGAGETVLDVTIDYISETSEGSGVYATLGVTGGDGDVDMGSASDVLAVGTSLDYNFNTLGHVLTEDSPATDEDYTENPVYAGWVFEVVYEIRVKGDIFGEDGFGEVSIPIVHDSPNKIGKNKVYPDPGDPIPEPMTLGLLGLGAAGVLLRRHRRRA